MTILSVTDDALLSTCTENTRAMSARIVSHHAQTLMELHMKLSVLTVVLSTNPKVVHETLKTKLDGRGERLT